MRTIRLKNQRRNNEEEIYSLLTACYEVSSFITFSLLAERPSRSDC